jgi:hypothetical protein
MRKFRYRFIRVRHWSLLRVRRIQATPPSSATQHPCSYYSHACLDLPRGFSIQVAGPRFSTQFLSFACMLHVPSHLTYQNVTQKRWHSKQQTINHFQVWMLTVCLLIKTPGHPYCSVPPKSLMSQSRRPLLSNVYNQNAYFSGNGVRTSLIAAVLKAFPIQCTYVT